MSFKQLLQDKSYNKSLLILALSLIWGCNFPISKHVLTILTVAEVRFISSTISFLISLSLFIYTFQNIKRIATKELVNLCIVSAPALSIVPALNIMSLSYLDSSTATIYIYLMPSITSVILYLFGMVERKLSLLLAPGLALIGILCLNKFRVEGNIGELVIIISAILWSTGAIFSAKSGSGFATLSSFSVQLLFNSIVNLLVFIHFVSFDHLNASIHNLNISLLLSLLFIGGGANCIAFYIWNNLISDYGAEYVSYSVLMAPIISVILSILFLSERFSCWEVFSLIFIVLSIYAKNRVKGIGKCASVKIK